MDREVQLRRQRKSYFDELMVYRMAMSTPMSTQFRKEQAFIKVKLFDETAGLDPEVKDMLNDRLTEVVTEYRSYVSRDLALHAQMIAKLDRFEKLPVDRKFLANMKIEEIFRAIYILERDPHEVWTLIQKVFHECFFDNVVF